MRFACVVLFSLVTTPFVLAAQDGRPEVKIAMVSDGPSPLLESWIASVQEEVDAQIRNRYRVEFVRTAAGDWTADGVQRQLDAVYADREVAAVFGFGELTAQAVGRRKSLPKPTILPFVLEAERLGLPRRGDTSGRTNLSYITDKLDLSGEVKGLRAVAGSTRIAVLVSSEVKGFAREISKTYGIRVAVIEDDVARAVAAIPDDVDGVIVAQNPSLSEEGRKLVIQALTERRLPNVTMGPDWVDQGALMTLRSRNYLPRRAQRAALNLDLILEGRPARSLHVDFTSREELVINMAAAKALGVNPSFEVLIEAEVIQDQITGDVARITMNDAMNEAVDNNLDLLASEKFVGAGAEEVKSTRGPLLPQGTAGASVVLRDPDRVFYGTQRTGRQANWSARASQILYSEQAWQRFKARKHLQSAFEYGYLTDTLDTRLDAGAAYVRVLRAQAIERIQRKNIKVTRENLDLAQTRLDVGIANASEVYRWQVTLAENQRSVVDARADVAKTKIELNRVLNRLSEQPVAPVDLWQDQDRKSFEAQDPISSYLGDPRSFASIRNFMVEEGMRNSPEVKDINSRKDRQERIIEGNRRQLWLPEFFVEGGIVHDYWFGGEGSVAPPGFPAGLPGNDPFGWDVGAFAQIPLSRGGSLVAEIRQSARLIERLEAQRDAIKLSIDTGVRSELHDASAAHAGVNLTRKAAEAARNNLKLVTDLYRQGTVDIITLVDAQTQSLTAALAAADAVYGYALSLLFVDRASGHFRNLDSTGEQRAFANRLKAFVLSQESGR